MSKGQTLQDPFLNSLRKDRIPVSIFLVNGIKLQGQIESFDQYVVLLKNTVSQMVYKHAISTVVPARNPRSAGAMPATGGFGQVGGGMGFERSAGFDQAQGGYGVSRGSGFGGRSGFGNDRGGFAERGFDNGYESEQRGYGLHSERGSFGNGGYERSGFADRGFDSGYDAERGFETKGFEGAKDSDNFDDSQGDDNQEKF